MRGALAETAPSLVSVRVLHGLATGDPFEEGGPIPGDRVRFATWKGAVAGTLVVGTVANGDRPRMGWSGNPGEEADANE